MVKSKRTPSEPVHHALRRVFDTRWFVDTVRRGFEPADEANTSIRVLNVLQGFLGWPLEDIVAQNKERRGFVDYRLRLNRNAGLFVEVKRPGKIGRGRADLAKYIGVSKLHRDEIGFGVLTDLREWRFYLSGERLVALANDDMVRVALIDIESEAEASRLASLLAYDDDAATVRLRLLASLADSDEVLHYLLVNNNEVLSQVESHVRASWPSSASVSRRRIQKAIRGCLGDTTYPSPSGIPWEIAAAAMVDRTVARAIREAIQVEIPEFDRHSSDIVASIGGLLREP